MKNIEIPRYDDAGINLSLIHIFVMPVGDLPSMLSEHPVGVVAREVDACSFRDAIRVALRMNAIDCVNEINAASGKFSLDAVVRCV